VKNHFLPDENTENKIRHAIFQLMSQFERMDVVMTKLLSFELKEEKALDQIEESLIEMEKLHIEMTKAVKEHEKSKSIGEEIVYESSSLHEAVRRTYNLLTGLNVIDLNSHKWVSRTTRCLIDRVYYRQIKALVYKSSPPTLEEN